MTPKAPHSKTRCHIDDEIKLELLKRHLAQGIEQAERRDFSDLTVAQIAQSILAEGEN